mmetsp:Transcript_4244/g.11979  ORF Transcript_4244/g.11979 Transcript_4244/m.11979 type:complete len:606 (-) Transcript_4244:183-2000(-)
MMRKTTQSRPAGGRRRISATSSVPDLLALAAADGMQVCPPPAACIRRVRSELGLRSLVSINTECLPLVAVAGGASSGDVSPADAAVADAAVAHASPPSPLRRAWRHIAPPISLHAQICEHADMHPATPPRRELSIVLERRTKGWRARTTLSVDLRLLYALAWLALIGTATAMSSVTATRSIAARSLPSGPLRRIPPPAPADYVMPDRAGRAGRETGVLGAASLASAAGIAHPCVDFDCLNRVRTSDGTLPAPPRAAARGGSSSRIVQQHQGFIAAGPAMTSTLLTTAYHRHTAACAVASFALKQLSAALDTHAGARESGATCVAGRSDDRDEVHALASGDTGASTPRPLYASSARARARDRSRHLASQHWAAGSRKSRIAISRQWRRAAFAMLPLAEALGCAKLVASASEAGVALLLPREHSHVSAWHTVHARAGSLALARAQRRIDASLSRMLTSGSFEVIARQKSRLSVFDKVVLRGKAVGDLLAARVIVDSEEDCWRARASIAGLWQEQTGRFKDYIRRPKANGYQSLHMTVLMPCGRPLEVQIRTRAMHDAAEHGAAAWGRYKTQSVDNDACGTGVVTRTGATASGNVGCLAPEELISHAA